MDTKVGNSQDLGNGKKGINPLVAGIAGAAITALAAGTAVVLTDKKKRKTAGKILNNLNEKGKVFAKKAYDFSSDLGKRLQNASRKIQTSRRHGLRAD